MPPTVPCDAKASISSHEILLRTIYELITITHTKPLFRILSLLRKGHILQTPSVMQAHQRLLPPTAAACSWQCKMWSAQPQGEQALGLTRVCLLVMQAPAFLLGYDHETVINAPCSLLDTRYWYGAFIITITLPGALLMSSFYTGCLKRVNNSQSFPNLDMELGCQTPDPQHRHKAIHPQQRKPDSLPPPQPRAVTVLQSQKGALPGDGRGAQKL